MGYAELQDKVMEEWYRQHEPIPTRLNFDEVDDIDLNITQPPATQGKVVGGAEDENNREEDEFFTPEQTTTGVREKENKMSRFRTDGNTMVDSKAVVPVFSEPKPLNVLIGNILYGRPKRRVVLPEVLRSLYVVREVSLICGISPHERRAANCLFSARLTETDIVFKMSLVDVQRSVIESLYPRVEIARGAINLFTHVLNEAEKRYNKNTVKRLFCHTAMLTSDMKDWKFEKTSVNFNENMEDVLKNSLYYNLEEVELVFFPILIGTHFILMCMNVKECVVQIFDNILSNVTNVPERNGTLPSIMGAMLLDYMSYVKHPKHDKNG